MEVVILDKKTQLLYSAETHFTPMILCYNFYFKQSCILKKGEKLISFDGKFLNLMKSNV